MSDPFSTPQAELPRDRWGRPLITPPEGGEPIAYTRCTTFVGCLEDTYHLGLWQLRMAVLGMSRRKDLILAASAIDDPTDQYQKRKLNDIAKAAKDAAAGDAAANTGTAIHSLTERIDKGEGLGEFIPEEYLPDLKAYADITNGLEFLGIEGFCVRDDLRVGGTYDRILGFTEEFLDVYHTKHGDVLRYPGRDAEGRLVPNAGDPVQPGDAVIGDVKTGHVDLGAGKIAMQLGVYANSEDYDHSLGARSPLPGNPSKDWGVVIHLPAGTGTARLLWFDIRAGFEAASSLAVGVHAWRKRKDLTHAFASAQSNVKPGPTLVEQIAAAKSPDALRVLFSMNERTWTPGLTALAKARIAELAGGN
ncbi:hypothetical protein HPO96_37045 [Kribbella sandramycini]|uniref:PD-(D/E)XK nuclease superfamily protein n=1 Tax=Kribbella sandramycini TaxID=60450 RepID=A0A7Y4L9Q7_9ACTN|nr:hypothetical protein [Kribbella sandramycini]MBB6564405.1 hypothetical protein [Kribbella sandramycini]NOL45867.1 hypothetical protein [Kribbella sandramycini]